MKQISELIDKEMVIKQQQSEQWKTSQKLQEKLTTELSETISNTHSNKNALTLFAVMVGIWGVKLASHFIDDKISKIAAKEWSESISDLSAEQIKKAIDYCKITYEWPPSIHQFRKAALGIPSEEEAWSLVQHCNSMPEDAFLRACYSSIDWYRCKHFMSAQEARIEFRGIYEVALSKFMRIKNV